MTEEQLTPIIKKYLVQGLSETEILQALKDDENEVITFLELKMILADLDEILNSESETIEDLNTEKAKLAAEMEKQKALGGTTTLDMDATPAPGSHVSGSANLKSGASIKWALNAQGQIALLPGGEGEPTEDDMIDFQRVLQAELQKKMGIF